MNVPTVTIDQCLHRRTACLTRTVRFLAATAAIVLSLGFNHPVHAVQGGSTKNVKLTNAPASFTTFVMVMALPVAPDLADAISSGVVVLAHAPSLPAGAPALTVSNPATPGQFAIATEVSEDPLRAACLIIHEWMHIANGDPSSPSSTDPDAAWQAYACQEAAADCAALDALSVWSDEFGVPIPCSVKNDLISDLAQMQLSCTNGWSFIGPPPAPSCPNLDIDAIPCV